MIDEEFAVLKLAYRIGPHLRAIYDRREGCPITFGDARTVVRLRFEMFETFCAGQTIVFLNIATIECDFFFLDLEKTEYQQCLTDFSLIGV